MTEPSRPRPVPGPPRPAPVPDAAVGAPDGAGRPDDGAEPFADLVHRPVAEHVAVFEAEHARLQRELSAIDQV